MEDSHRRLQKRKRNGVIASHQSIKIKFPETKSSLQHFCRQMSESSTLTVEVAGQHNTGVLALGPGRWMDGFAMFAEVPTSFALLHFFRLALCQLNSKIMFDCHQVFGC